VSWISALRRSFAIWTQSRSLEPQFSEDRVIPLGGLYGQFRAARAAGTIQVGVTAVGG
jgi:hypothetical protein